MLHERFLAPYCRGVVRGRRRLVAPARSRGRGGGGRPCSAGITWRWTRNVGRDDAQTLGKDHRTMEVSERLEGSGMDGRGTGSGPRVGCLEFQGGDAECRRRPPLTSAAAAVGGKVEWKECVIILHRERVILRRLHGTA